MPSLSGLAEFCHGSHGYRKTDDHGCHGNQLMDFGFLSNAVKMTKLEQLESQALSLYDFCRIYQQMRLDYNVKNTFSTSAYMNEKVKEYDNQDACNGKQDSDTLPDCLVVNTDIEKGSRNASLLLRSTQCICTCMCTCSVCKRPERTVTLYRWLMQILFLVYNKDTHRHVER